MNSPLYIGGTPLIRTTIRDGSALDISGATTKQILLRKPDGTLLTKSAAFTTDGTDGKMQYQAVVTDFDVGGDWTLSAFLVLPSGDKPTEQKTLPVLKP